MTFEELSKEYEVSISVQKKAINSYREKLNKAHECHDFKEIKRLNSVLKILYEEKSELEERAVGIREYLS